MDYTANKHALCGLSFVKMCGAGNDFVVIDAQSLKETLPNTQALSKENIIFLCNRRYGVGADGLMVINGDCSSINQNTAPKLSFTVEFFNSDGTSGMLCGNGSRCAIEYARTRSYIEPGVLSYFMFGNKTYSCISKKEAYAQFFLESKLKIESNLSVNIPSYCVKGSFVDVNCAHFVVDINDIENSLGQKAFSSIDNIPIDSIGSLLRFHSAFAPLGANINFVEVRNNKLYIRTFERGVEDETLACGTGSVSSSIVKVLECSLSSPVTVVVKSGEELSVSFDSLEKTETCSNTTKLEAKNLSLSGPAFISFSGKI